MALKAKKPWTADELSRLPEGWRYEIDEGQLVIMSPGVFRHSRAVGSIFVLLWAFVHEAHLGEVFTGELGVRLGREPETLRGVDAAFYSSARLEEIKDERGFPDIPPDLAVEMLLPDEGGMQRKVQQYLSSGVLSVWVVDPEAKVLVQYRPGAAPKTTSDPEATIEEPVLPGFSCRLRNLFGEE